MKGIFEQKPQRIHESLFVMVQDDVNMMITPYLLITVSEIGHLGNGTKIPDSTYRQKIQFSCLLSVHHVLLWPL